MTSVDSLTELGTSRTTSGARTALFKSQLLRVIAQTIQVYQVQLLIDLKNQDSKENVSSSLQSILVLAHCLQLILMEGLMEAKWVHIFLTMRLRGSKWKTQKFWTPNTTPHSTLRQRPISKTPGRDLKDKSVLCAGELMFRWQTINSDHQRPKRCSCFALL